jgi:two-component system NtrC family response regulator
MDDSDLKILIIDDEPNIRTGLCKGLQNEADVVEEATDGTDGLTKFERTGHEIVITDLRLPGEVDGLEVVKRIHERRPETHTIVITAHGTVATAVEAMRRGAFDFIAKPIDLNVIRHQVQKAAEHHRLVAENRRLREQLAEMGGTPEIVGNCAATQDVLRQIRQVAPTDATVLLLGESGTGKELTARAIHQLSERRENPFVTVTLGALPDSLLESELFGHEQGAFTDARRQKVGRIEAAAGGTLFLDEITETSPKSQVDLLRVLEEREFRRLGGDHTIAADVRIISATNKDIVQMVTEGTFREDLYYRLNVVPMRVPPLRERREDIPLLVEHFLGRFCERHRRAPKRFATEAMRTLVAHDWPGNIRQLRNVVERLVVTVEGDVIHADDLPSETHASPPGAAQTLTDAVEQVEKQAILAALAACDYHRERTAQLLNVSVRTLHYKMNRYGLH